VDALQVRVVSPDRTVFSGDAASIVAPAWDGRVGILKSHAPLITLLGSGPLVIDKVGGGSVSFYVAGGIMKVEDDWVTVLTEYAGTEPPATVPPDAIIRHEDLESFPSSAGDPLV
jgi:F-type H+-transporting ATPase subunit epsilon